jgi:thiamine biosynthesis lipoprotein
MPMSSSETMLPFSLRQEPTHWVVAFRAMACPCEILIRSRSASDVESLASLAWSETSRIEAKFSRYRDDNVVFAINHAGGHSVAIDDETHRLLQYASECYELSGGLFDVTSGILRQAWEFKGQKFKPNRLQISSILKYVGWDKVELTENAIQMAPNMQIDLGGVGKEYAVDRVAQLALGHFGLPLLVNFGGDIRIPSSGDTAEPWHVGLSNPEKPEDPIGKIELADGAVTTSGVSYRHCFVNGKRLGHILDPRTGWPVEGAPRSVTVVADSCLEAGIFSTLAMLQGSQAEAFLDDQGLTSHCIW